MPLGRELSTKDLGVIVDTDLSFSIYVQEKINCACKMPGIINRNFRSLDKSSFLCLYKSLVRSQLDCCSSVLNPFKIGLIKDIEKVQKRATKMLRCCKYMSYKDRRKD